MTTAEKVDRRRLRDALGTFATGVTIVTAADAAGHPVGVTANSFNSASLDPPLVLWGLALAAHSLPVFEQSAYFAVHVLRADQADLARRFATRGADKFAALDFTEGPGRVPLLGEYAARFECRKVGEFEGGDHRIFLGEVIDLDYRRVATLVFHAGRFTIAQPASPHPSATAARDGVASSAAAPNPHDAHGANADERDAPGRASAFGPDFLLYLLDRCYRQLNVPYYAEVASQGLSLGGAKLLAVLSTVPSLTLAEVAHLEPLLEHLAGDVVDELARRDLVLLDGYNGSAIVMLSPGGRAVAARILEAGHSLESSASSSLRAEDSRALKMLLARLVEGSDPGLPDPFRGIHWEP